MKIEIRLFAGLSKYVEGTITGEPFEYGLDNDSTVSDLINKLDIPENEVFITIVNSQSALPETTLKEGDRVGIFPPVGGG